VVTHELPNGGSAVPTSSEPRKVPHGGPEAVVLGCPELLGILGMGTAIGRHRCNSFSAETLADGGLL
jgi:hypothetical protein